MLDRGYGRHVNPQATAAGPRTCEDLDVMSENWGRIDDTGAVFVRTSDGERQIGSWQAGTVEEGLAYYVRKFDDLAADVRLLEGRINSPAADAQAVAEATTKLKETLVDAAAIGDLDALRARLDAVLGKVEERRAERAAARAAANEAAVERKRGLIAEAKKISESESWRAGSERFRAIVEEWKTIRVDRKTDSSLWEEFSAARRTFDSRRRAHYAEVETQRSVAEERKTKLCQEAEKLAQSTEWTPTARRFRDLMNEWKAAGRAPRDTEEALWQRFKAAQDLFFAKRSEVFAARDSEQAANLEAKQALITEARALDAKADPDGARKRLKSIHDRWEKVGHVPRDAKDRLEDQLAAVERSIRDATAAARVITVTESPLVIRLRESVDKLEARLGRAQKAGDSKLAAETEAALATQREWLAQAEATTD